ncbi:MAG: glycosyltransferase [Saprospiraceae bacterium]|nr:glycosyltransferase [Saprospiraceae bacterium]
MRILIISRSFYPMNTPRSSRTTELAIEFAKRGLTVTVCTNSKPEVQNEFLRENNLSIIDLDVLKVEAPIHSQLKRYFIRLAGILFEYPSILYSNKVKNVIRKYGADFDVIISIAVPHTIHWGVASGIQKRKNYIWIADCGDPFMGNRMDRYRKPFYFKYVEKWWCRKADHITVPITAAINAYYVEFWHKISAIPQGFNFDEVRRCLEPYKENEPVSFAYAGSFIEGLRDPRPVLEYLLSTSHDFRFYIYNRDKRLTAELAAKSGGRVVLMDTVPRTVLLSILSRMDFLLNLENGVPEVLPSKLIEYSLTNRPVLSVDSNRMDKENILRFLHRDYSGRFVIGDIEKYNIKNVVDQFLALCKR